MKDFFKNTVFELAKQSNCVSRKVGAIIVRDKRIISTGYNGSLPGAVNCCDVFDSKDFDKDEHHFWSKNNEIHAEQNCLMMAAKHGISVNDAVCYSTLQPCNSCLLLLSQAGIKTIYYYKPYDKSNYGKDFVDYLKAIGTELIHLK